MMLEAAREIELALPGRYDVSPAQRGLILTVPGLRGRAKLNRGGRAKRAQRTIETLGLDNLRMAGSEMADIFLSYAREDLAIAGRLAELLEANGLTVWWDRRLVAGDEINDAIEKAIDQAKAVVVLWSPNSVGSRWVRGEAETAAEANKLIPIRIADCKLPLSFRGLHTPDVFASRKQISELADLLSAKLRPGAPSERRIELSQASTGKFLDDLKGLMTSPSAKFADQFHREWEFGRRYPLTYWGGGLGAYLLCVVTLMGLLDIEFTNANVLVCLLGLVAYFAYRHHRLSRSM